MGALALALAEAIDAAPGYAKGKIARELPVVALPGYSRPLIRAEDYRHLLDGHTYRGDRVRPS